MTVALGNVVRLEITSRPDLLAPVRSMVISLAERFGHLAGIENTRRRCDILIQIHDLDRVFTRCISRGGLFQLARIDTANLCAQSLLYL